MIHAAKRIVFIEGMVNEMSIIDGDRIMLFDGAMGSMLQSAGMKAGEVPESYNIEAPDIIYNIHNEIIITDNNREIKCINKDKNI